MNPSPTIQRRSRWHILAGITLAIHLSIYFSPIPIQELRSSASGAEQYLILLVPAIWSISIFLCYRQRSERVVAWCSLVATILWFTSVGGIRT
jgi:hypothetical protein